jgi:hypothetical protein
VGEEDVSPVFSFLSFFHFSSFLSIFFTTSSELVVFLIPSCQPLTLPLFCPFFSLTHAHSDVISDKFAMAKKCKGWAYSMPTLVVELLELLSLGETLFSLRTELVVEWELLAPPFLLPEGHYFWLMLSMSVRVMVR